MQSGQRFKSSRKKDPLKTSPRQFKEMNLSARSILIWLQLVRKSSMKKKPKILSSALSMVPSSTDPLLPLLMPNTSKASLTTRARWIWPKELMLLSNKSLRQIKLVSSFLARPVRNLAARFLKILKLPKLLQIQLLLLWRNLLTNLMLSKLKKRKLWRMVWQCMITSTLLKNSCSFIKDKLIKLPCLRNLKQNIQNILLKTTPWRRKRQRLPKKLLQTLRD